jgi:hypothetical protein
MNIEEQVELLMQGTDYGDEDLQKAMASELRERLKIAEKENRPLRVYCGYDPRQRIYIWGTPFPCANCVNFKTSVMKSLS